MGIEPVPHTAVDEGSLRLLHQTRAALQQADMEDTLTLLRDRFSSSRRVFETGAISQQGITLRLRPFAELFLRHLISIAQQRGRSITAKQVEAEELFDEVGY